MSVVALDDALLSPNAHPLPSQTEISANPISKVPLDYAVPSHNTYRTRLIHTQNCQTGEAMPLSRPLLGVFPAWPSH